ncbi:helix-turn-helix domain-containing protein [Luteipulveratus halotolerans]|nr:helix-turn-helix transcriptional regulator [Luteipulveratus halotolerans]
MSDREIRYSAELRRRLELVLGDETPSEAQLSRMVRARPERLTMRTLEGLCEVLACEPGDLLTRPRTRQETTMSTYESPEELAEAIGLQYDPGSEDIIPGFPSEADWGWNASGLGTGPDQDGGRWLVTFARARADAAEGHLIGYEVDGRHQRTGRCVLIRSPWTAERDQTELHRAIREGWWEPNGLSTLHDLDARLIR